MTRRFLVVVVPDPEDGGYVASVPALPGVYGQGETEEEAFEDAKAALTFTLDDMVERGESLPPGDGVALLAIYTLALSVRRLLRIRLSPTLLRRRNLQALDHPPRGRRRPPRLRG